MGSSFSTVTAVWQFPGFGTLKILQNQGVSSETEQLLHCANHLNILTLFLFDIDKHSNKSHFACYTKYCQHLNTIDKCNFSALRAKLHGREENKPTHAEKRGVYFKKCITKNLYLVQTELYNNLQLFQISQFIPNLRDRITKLLFLIYRKVPWKKLVHKVFIMFTTSVNRIKIPVIYEWHFAFNVNCGASWWFLWEHSRVPEDKRHYLWTHKHKYNFIWVVLLGTARTCTIYLAWIVARNAQGVCTFLEHSMLN